MSEDSRAYFDDIAPHWDGMQQEFFSDSVRETALAVAGVKTGERAADIGAGTGFITTGLLGKGVRVVAVDQSQEMLDQMRQKFADRADVEYRRGDEQDLPLTDRSMDYVFANMYLHHVEHPAAAIGEMARVLAPGGKLVITDLDEHEFEFLRTEQHDRWLGFDRKDVESWFRGAGLEDVVVDCVGQDCCASSAEGEAASVSIFVASGTRHPA